MYKGASTASSNKQGLALGIKLSLRRRDAIVRLSVVGLDLGRPDIQHLLQIVRRHF